jgi:hypothetical protein
MLTPWQVENVRRLLSEGRSQREIRRVTGIARGTIAAIAHGRRPDYEAIRRAKREETRTRPLGRPERCPVCGHIVCPPCRVCHARRCKRISHQGTGPQSGPSFGGPLVLELTPEDQVRYEEVQARHGLAMNRRSHGVRGGADAEGPDR